MKTTINFENNRGEKINLQIEASSMEIVELVKNASVNFSKAKAYEATEWLLEKAADFTKKFRVKEKEVKEFTKNLEEESK